MRKILLVKPQGRQAVNPRGCLEEEDEEKSHALELGMEVWLVAMWQKGSSFRERVKKPKIPENT